MRRRPPLRSPTGARGNGRTGTAPFPNASTELEEYVGHGHARPNRCPNSTCVYADITPARRRGSVACRAQWRRGPYQGKAPLFSANYQYNVRTHSPQSRAAARAAPSGVRGTATPPARAPSRAPLDVRFSGLCVRAGVRSEHFQVEIGQVVLTSRHWKPV